MLNAFTLNGATLNGQTPPSPAIDFERALVAALQSNVALTAVIGTNLSPVKIPQGVALPALSYQVTEKPRPQSLSGPNGTASARVLLVVRSNRTVVGYADCKAVAQALRDAFDGFQGVLFGVKVIEAALKDESDGYKQPQDGSDAGTYEIPVDFLFRYREPLPKR